MIKINEIPVGFPAKMANGIMIRVMPFQTNAVNCSTYYELTNTIEVIDSEEVVSNITEVLANGNIFITDEQFLNWGSENTYIEDIVLTNLGLERA